MSERPADMFEVMGLLEKYLHPLSPDMLTQISRVDGMTIDGENSPEELRAAQALVKIGALEVITERGIKEITETMALDAKAGNVVSVFPERRFVLAREPWEAIMKWTDDLNI